MNIFKDSTINKETQERNARVRKQLLQKYPYSKEGIWRIRGEDSNADLGGHHHMPELCLVACTYGEAVDLAVSLSGFWQWGAGGDIQEVVVSAPIDVMERTELQAELDRLEERVKELKKKLHKI